MAMNFRSPWLAPLSIICLGLVFLLIASTIVLALIPIYISNQAISGNTTAFDDTLIAGYATDLIGGESLTLDNTDSVASQLTSNTGILSSNLNLQSGSFASSTAASGRKRDVSSGNPSCEQSTSLTGNIFVGNYRMKYPAVCVSTSCRDRYKAKYRNALRMNYRTVSIYMKFTDGSSRVVQLFFCNFLTSDYTANPTTTPNTNTTTSNSTSCTAATKNYIYLMDANSALYRFDPISLTVTNLTTINCSSSGLFSMAIQQNGTIWALFQDGNLYTYNIDTQQCNLTQYVANQFGIFYFTMAFVKSNVNDSETLYISQNNNTGNVLATIDTNTFNLTVINNYAQLQEDADITGTNDGRLFGVFSTDNYTIAEINQTNADITAQYPLNISSTIVSDPNYGFAATYNSSFYFFSGLGNDTTVYLFDLLTNTTTNTTTLPQTINGAAVSTCFGTA